MRVAGRQLLAAAEQVQFLDFRAELVGATCARHGKSGVGRPDIFGTHPDVDDPIVPGDRSYARLAQVTLAAQRPLRFVQHAARIGIAAREQQLRADRRFARRHMQPVRRAVQQRVLARVAFVEDVVAFDFDRANACACPLEFGIGRQDGRRVMADRRRVRAGRQAGKAQQGERGQGGAHTPRSTVAGGRINRRLIFAPQPV
jgi:hypothetical protein